MIRIDVWEELQEKLKKLTYHYDHTVNLWATDKTVDEIVNKALYDGFERNIKTNTPEESMLFDRIEDDIKEEFNKVMFQIK